MIISRSRVLLVSVCLAIIGVLPATSRASTPGSDNASTNAYSGGWTNGSNGGTAFQPWSLNPTNTGGGQGYYIGSSTANGGGNSGNDINTTNSKAWGFYSNNGNVTAAERQFSNGGLIISQKCTIAFDNGYINSGGPSVGVGLQGTNDTARFEFYFAGGDSQYRIHDSGGATVSTSIGWTHTGLNLTFTLTGTNSYSLFVTNLSSGTTYSFTGNLTGLSNAPIDRVRLWNANAGNGSNYDAFANSLKLDCNGYPVTVAGNNGPVCVGNTLSLTAIGDSIDTYSWTGPASYTSSNQNPTISSVTTNTAGTYTVTRTKNGCVSVGQTTVVVVNTNPVTVAGNNGPLCVGLTLDLTATGPTNGIYSWIGPAFFTSSQQNPTISNIQTNQAGNYSVSVTVNGCSSTSSVTAVTVNLGPTTTAGSDSPHCVGDTLNLTATGSSSDSYSWNGPNGFSSTNQDPTVTSVTTNAAGTYNVVRTIASCGTSPTSSVTVVVNPIPTTSAGNNGPLCAGQTLNLTATGNTNDTYSWTGPNSFSSSSQNPSVSGVTAGYTGNYTVTRTVSGCTSPAATTTVTVAALPTCSISGAGSICAGSTGNTYTGPSNMVTYSWSVSGNGSISGTSTSQSVNITGGSAGSLTVNLTVTDSDGCTNSCSQSVTVNAIPVPSPGNNGPLCAGQTLNLSAVTVTNGTYSWTGPSGFSSTSQNLSISNAQPTNSGSYCLSVSVNGCTSTQVCTSATVNALPGISASPTNLTVCLDNPATFNVSATGAGLNYFWRKRDTGWGGGGWTLNAGGGGFFIADSTQNDSGDPASNGGHDINSANNVTWGLYNNSGALTEALRPFNATLGVGQQFAIDMDNGNVPSGSVGFGLQNTATSSNRFEIYFRSGQTNYKIDDNSGEVDTGMSFTRSGIHVLFTLTGTNSYSVTITKYIDGTTVTFSGTLISTSSTGIDRLRLFNAIGAGGQANNVYFNNVLFNTEDDNVAAAAYNTGNWTSGEDGGQAPIAGAANASSYSTNSATTGNAGFYDVVVSGTCNPVAISAAASLTVNVAPAITNQPAGQTVCLGNSVNLAVSGTGSSPLFYQWQKNSANITGATNGSYTIGSVATGDTGTYSVLISNSCGSVTSMNAVLTVNTPPSISAQPSNATVCVSNFVSFSVSATGTGPLHYLWRKGGAGWGDWGAWILGNTSGDTNQDGEFIGPSGNIDTTGRSWGLYANSGQTASAIRPFNGYLPIGQTFKIDMANTLVQSNDSVGFGLQDALGTNRFEFFFSGGSTQYSINDGSNTVRGGALTTSVGYTTNGLHIEFTLNTGDTYSVSIVSLGGDTNVITGPLEGVTYANIAQVRLFNYNAGTGNNLFFNNLSLPGKSDNAADAEYNVSYTNLTWYTGDGSGWQLDGANYGGANNYGWFIGSSTNTGQADPGNDSRIDTAGSKAWGLWANTFGIVEARRSFNGPMAIGNTFRIAMCNGYVTNGASVGFDLQDFSGTNRFELYFGGGSADYFIHDNSGGARDTSVPWTSDGLWITFTLTSTDTYSVVISNATPNTYGVGNIGSLPVTITGTLTGFAGTSINRVRVYNFTAGDNTPHDFYVNSISVGSNLYDNASDPAYSSGWNNGSDGGRSLYSAPDSNTFTIASSTTNDVAWYDVILSNACASLLSSEGVLTVLPLPSATASNNSPICAGQTLSLYGGGTANATYSWTGPGGFASTNQNPSITNATTAASGTYCLAVTSSSGCVSSQACTVATVNALPTATVSGSASICSGSLATIQATLTGTPDWIVTWSDGVTTNYTTSPATRTIRLITSIDSSTVTNFTVTSVSDANCTGTVSGSAVVTVNPAPIGTMRTSANSVCVDSSSNSAYVYYSLVQSGASYAWSINNGTITSDPTASSIAWSAGTSTPVTVTVVITIGAECSSTQSATVTVTTFPDPTITVAAAVCAGSSGNTASVPDAGSNGTYSWSIDQGSIDTGQYTRSITWTAGGAGSANLSVSVANGSGCTSNSTATVQVNPTPDPTITAASWVCSQSTGNVASVAGAGPSATYVWSVTGGSILTGQGSNAITWAASASGTASLSVSMTNAFGCSSSGSTNLPILLPTVISNSLVSQLVCAGSNVIFAVSAGGGSLTYQWQQAGTNLVDGGNIEGSSTPTLTMSNATTVNAGSYRLVVSGACGVQTSSVANLSVDAPVSITTSPTNLTACVGASASLSVSASGGDIHYIWRKGGAGWGGFGAWAPGSNDNSSALFIGSSGTIDTAGRAWGLFDNGQVGDALRPINGPLAVGCQLSLDMANGDVNSGGTVGFALWNAEGEHVWEFYFSGGSDFYTVNDANGPTTTEQGFTTGGLHVDFTLISPTNYTAAITELAGNSEIITGALINPPSGDQTITRVRLFSASAVTNMANSVYFNNLIVCGKSDNAGDSVYDDGWFYSDGGGWELSFTSTNTSMNGRFMQSSIEPGHEGNIDSPNGKAWGLFANNGNTSTAMRAFNGPLQTGQVFAVDMENGVIGSGGSCGFELQDSTGTNRFEFIGANGLADYLVLDVGGTNDTGVGLSNGGLHLTFTLTGSNSYIFAVGTNTVHAGTLEGVTNAGIDRVVLFNANCGAGSTSDVFFNNISAGLKSDNAGDPAYAGGWNTGTDGGHSLNEPDSNTLTIASVSASDAGCYDVVVNNACSLMTTSTPAVLTVPLVASISGPTNVAARCTGSYSAPVGTGVTYQWTISGDGTIDSPSTQPTVLVIAGDASNSTFTLTLTLTDQGCSSVASNTVTVNPQPGWRGEYYSDQYFNNLALIRMDPAIDFSYSGTNSPAPGMPPIHFSVRWTGQVVATNTATYHFQTYSDDGVRLWINDQLLIDDWQDQTPTYQTCTAALTNNQVCNVRIEYYLDFGAGRIDFGWGLPFAGPIVYTDVPSSEPPVTNSLDGVPSALASALGITALNTAAATGTVSMGEQLFQAFNDPLTNDLDGTFADVVSVTGSETNDALGLWQVDGTEIFAVDRRGYAEYQMAVPSANVYRLAVDGREENAAATDFSQFDLQAYIDGEYLGRQTLVASPVNYGEVHYYTPWLLPGSHLIRIFWDNAADATSLRIQSLALQTLGGPVNSNGVSSWVNTRLRTTCGLDVTQAMTSFTSPACLEGRGGFLSMMDVTAVDPSADATNDIIPQANVGYVLYAADPCIPPHTGPRWYADVPLSPDTGTVVSVSYQNGGLIQSNTVTWTPVNVLQGTNLTIRVNDSLLFTAIPTGTNFGNVVININGEDYRSTSDAPTAYQFTTSGINVVTGTFYGTNGLQQSGTFTVDVVGYDFGSGPDCWLPWTRGWFYNEVVPGEASLQGDPRFIRFPSPVNNQGGWLLIDQNETRPIISRIGTNGAILASTTGNGLQLYGVRQTSSQVLTTYPDGTRLVEILLVESPVVSDVTIQVYAAAGGITLDDGTTERTLTAADFDELGQYWMMFLMAPDVTSSSCYKLNAYQGTQSLFRCPTCP